MTPYEKLDYVKKSLCDLPKGKSDLFRNVFCECATNEERLEFFYQIFKESDELKKQVANLEGQVAELKNQIAPQKHDSDAVKGELESSISRTTAFLNSPKNRNL